jgi:hypothetical protein
MAQYRPLGLYDYVKTNVEHSETSHHSLPPVHLVVQLRDLVANRLVRSSRHGVWHDGHFDHVVPGAGISGELPPYWA